MPAVYRNAVPTDAATIVDFQLAMARETESIELDREVVTRGVQAVFDDPAHGRYFVAEKEGVLAGSLMITFEWSDWRAGVVWWIQSVYVTPEQRRVGIYTGLYRYIMAIAAAEDSIRGIRLYVDRRNRVAQEVYRRLGMDGEHYQVFEWMKG